MTAGKLYRILEFLEGLDKRLGLQSHLEAVREALNSLVSSPAQPQYQNTLVNSLAAFVSAAAEMARSITPSQATEIEEMGGGEVFDPLMGEKVTSSIQSHAMTPSVARDFVKELARKRADFLETISNARRSLEQLGITGSALDPGQADVAFLIPRGIFDNELTQFAKELTFLSRLVQDFTEAQTGTIAPVTLEQLSSSIPTVTVLAALPALQMLGMVINKYLEAWERIQKIRRMREELAQLKLKKSQTALDELTEEINTEIDEVVEESTELVIKNYKGARDDLANAIRADVRRLFGQIERGLTVEFRANPSGADEANKDALQQISDIGRELTFPGVAKEPLLLKSGEVIEDSTEGDDEVQLRHTKKTATHSKSTTSKKESKQEQS